jgi:hypothetical protein
MEYRVRIQNVFKRCTGKEFQLSKQEVMSEMSMVVKSGLILDEDLLKCWMSMKRETEK